MNIHYHLSVENIMLTGLEALLFLNFLKWLAGVLVKNAATNKLGLAIAGVIKF